RVRLRQNDALTVVLQLRDFGGDEPRLAEALSRGARELVDDHGPEVMTRLRVAIAGIAQAGDEPGHVVSDGVSASGIGRLALAALLGGTLALGGLRSGFAGLALRCLRRLRCSSLLGLL